LTIQPAFRGSLLENLHTSMNAPPSGEPPMSATLGSEIDKLSVSHVHDEQAAPAMTCHC
jgi:hypothetical protein